MTDLEQLTKLIHSQENEILDWDYSIDCEHLAQAILDAGWQAPEENFKP